MGKGGRMSRLEKIILGVLIVAALFAPFLLIPGKEDKVVLCPSAEQQIEFIKASKSYSKQWCMASGKSEDYCNDDWLEFINCVDYPECGWEVP